ncbi:MAG: sugar kinase [Qipengyuania sp.]|nr:sugar kinase [Qipengyuania sp.]
MLEYHSHGGAGLRYGGDTLNTAIHMARRGCDVAYVTAVGIDPISDALVASWVAEGIDTAHVHRHPERSLGIYAIYLDPAGERSFLYWRDRSAAREMFDLPGMEATLEEALDCALIYFSLISLAVVDDRGRSALLGLSNARKAGGRAVAYDSNYRPALWRNPSEAQVVSSAAVSAATLGLPTNVDERQLFTCADSEQDIANRWHAMGCDEVVVKAGEQGCVYAGPDAKLAFPSHRAEVIDSSGAGDAFNAGFLQARLGGADPAAAIEEAQALARETLGHFGAIFISGCGSGSRR